MKNSSEKQILQKNFFKKIPGYARRGSSSKKIGDEPDFNEDQNTEKEDVTSVFKTRKKIQHSGHDSEKSDSSHSNHDESESGSEDEELQSPKKTSSFSVKSRSSRGDYHVVDNFVDEESDSDVDGSSEVDHSSSGKNPPSVTRSDWSCHTGETLRHSNVTSVPKHPSKVNITADCDGSYFTEQSDIEGKMSSNKRTSSSRRLNDDRKNSQENGIQLRNWVVIFLFLVAFLMSTYSSLGCKFLSLNIGFDPTNVKWKQRVDIGPWSYSSSDLTSSGPSDKSKCLAYPSGFYSKYISSDNKWTLLRGLIICSLVLHWLAFLMLLLLGIKSDIIPMSNRCLRMLHTKWKRRFMILSVVLLGLEACKFIFLSNTLCKSSIWTTGTEQITKVAKSCDPGTGLHITFFTMLFYFVICLIICTTPSNVESRRMPQNELNPEYNIVNQDINDEPSDPSLKVTQMTVLVKNKVEGGEKSMETKGKFFGRKVSRKGKGQ